MLDEITVVHKPIETFVDSFTCKSLIIWGDNDWANVTLNKKLKIKNHDRCLELGLKSVVLEHGGHDMNLHQPEKVSNLILQEF